MSEMFVFVASAKVPVATQKQLASLLNAAIAARLNSENQRWAQVVKASGFRAES